MTLSPLPEESSLPNSSQALPRISLQQSIAQRSHEFQTGSLHHAHASAQTPATDAVATPQHASPAQEQSNHSHLTSHDQSQVQHAGGQSAAQFQTGAAANLAQIPEVVSVTAPSQQFDEGKQYSSQASGLSAQAAQAAAVSDGSISAQQQAGSNESQAAGVQQQPATAPAGADNLAAAAPSQSTADKQPPPVVPARVPLKKGEIADSFRALVREVCACS